MSCSLFPWQEPILPKHTTLLSLGMGVESVAILVRWLLEAQTRPCPLEELIAITAMTGDEYEDTGSLMERYILPLMRDFGIRYVQVARVGSKESDGIVVLDDSRRPQRLYLEGAYKLSGELRVNGTVPQFTGVHKCALKFKAFVIERWLDEHIRSGLVRHAIGYNAGEKTRIANSEYATRTRELGRERIAFGFNIEERKRIDRSLEYNTFAREAFYPLVDWGWTRQMCAEYLTSKLGIVWPKSACVYCPFAALKAEGIARQKRHPAQVADALLLEYTSRCLNPRGTLYKDKSLFEISVRHENREALSLFAQQLNAVSWALYRVRRIFNSTASGQKGTVHRCIEKLETFPLRMSALATLLRYRAKGEYETMGDIPYIWIEKRADRFPTREEMFCIAPAIIETKARYGVPWFDRKRYSKRLFQDADAIA